MIGFIYQYLKVRSAQADGAFRLQRGTLQTTSYFTPEIIWIRWVYMTLITVPLKLIISYTLKATVCVQSFRFSKQHSNNNHECYMFLLKPIIIKSWSDNIQLKREQHHSHPIQSQHCSLLTCWIPNVQPWRMRSLAQTLCAFSASLSTMASWVEVSLMWLRSRGAGL